MQIRLLRRVHSFGRRFADDNGLAVCFPLSLSRITNRTGYFTMYIFNVRVIADKTEIYYLQYSLQTAQHWCVGICLRFRSLERNRSRDRECILSEDSAAVPF